MTEGTKQLHREFVDTFLRLLTSKGWPPDLTEMAKALKVDRSTVERRKLKLQVLGVVVCEEDRHRAWRIDIEAAVKHGIIESWNCGGKCVYCGAKRCKGEENRKETP